MSKRVAVYARVSTTRQAENDISIPDQLKRAERYCRERGWTIAREFVDPGASALDDKRPEFQRMMDAACVDPSPFDVVLVHSQSRFFRDTAGYVNYKRLLQKHGVLLVSMTQDFGVGPAADFAETVLAASDALFSAENAKHVKRTMLENARQGYWNGAKPPFGYRTVVVEQRGQRTKKRLEIEPREAEIVRQMFELALSGDGVRGAMGVKEIVSWLNARSLRNSAGKLFYTSQVHAILTSETYTGTHYYNQTDSRTGKPRPREEWVGVAVPRIIAPERFRQLQEQLYQRRPAVTPPRITTSPVLLSGLARCSGCGTPLMLSTGKSGRYRYYVCASKRLKGKTSCSAPVTLSMAEFDGRVLSALTEHLLTPERLSEILFEAQRLRRSQASDSAARRTVLRKQRKDTEAQLQRLYGALAAGTVGDTPSFRKAVKDLEAGFDETNRLLSRLETVAPPPLRQALSKAQASAVAARFRRCLSEAPAAVQRRYVQGLVSEIVVDRQKAIISGPKAALAAAVSAGDMPAGVLTSVRKWRTGQDSNPRPPDS